MNIGILGVGAIGGLLASQLVNEDKNIVCLGSSSQLILSKKMEFY